MNLPFQVSEKQNAVNIRNHIDRLSRESHHENGFSYGYDEKSMAYIDKLFKILQEIEPDDEHGTRRLWLCAKRGTIEDFAESYGSYEGKVYRRGSCSRSFPR